MEDIGKGAVATGSFFSTIGLWGAGIFGVIFFIACIGFLGTYIHSKTSSTCRSETPNEKSSTFSCNPHATGGVTAAFAVLTAICILGYWWNKTLLKKNKSGEYEHPYLLGATGVFGIANVADTMFDSL